MSDSGTDTFVGVVIVLAIIGGVVSAANGGSNTNASGSSSPTSSPTSTSRAAPTRTASGTGARPSSNIPGGPLFACTGTVISDRSAGSGSSAVNLKVYYSPTAGGRNCAVVTKVGSGSRRSGQLVVSLRFADYTGKKWPDFAEHRSTASATRSGSVYLTDTDGRCVRAQARFVPADGGRPVEVSSGRTGCG